MNIDELSGQDLDSAVAETKGWRWTEYAGSREEYILMPPSWVQEMREECKFTRDQIAGKHTRLRRDMPRYSADPAAAMGLLEEAEWANLGKSKGEWDCEFWFPGQTQEVAGYGPTAGVAIARAFLKAKAAKS